MFNFLIAIFYAIIMIAWKKIAITFDANLILSRLESSRVATIRDDFLFSSINYFKKRLYDYQWTRNFLTRTFVRLLSPSLHLDRSVIVSRCIRKY